MVRTTRTHVGPDSLPTEGVSSKHLSKQEFASRLYQLMNAKGWIQSELSRRSGVPRDSVSTYMNGKAMPTPANLKKLAEALGMAPTDLLPNHVERAIENDIPAFEMRVSPSAPTLAWVRINRAMPTHIALKLAALLGEADDAAAN